MAELTTSAKRVMAAYGAGGADCVPVLSPVGWDPLLDVDAEDPQGWRADPAFRRLARIASEVCVPKIPYNHVPYPSVWSPLPYQPFLEAPGEHIEKLPVEQVGPRRTRTAYLLHTPKGDLKWSYLEDEGAENRWYHDRAVSCPADVEKLLSVPFSFDKPPASAYEAYRRHRRQMGPLCLGGGRINSMVAMLVGVMDYQLLLEWVLTEPGLVKMLADAWLERTWAKADFLLSQGVGPFWHFNGVERAAPPMMGKKQWEELVVPYDGEIMRRIKARDPEARIHVHCHGKVGTLLDSWLALGVDSIDPVEPPPQGDIELVEAKRRVAGRMTLYGNIEFCRLDMGTPDEIGLLVRRAIQEGGPHRMVLAPSAVPFERLTTAFAANAERYLEAAVEYGGF